MAQVGHGAAAYYIFPLNLAAEQIAEAFLSLSGELAQVSFVLEIEWTHRGVRLTSRAVAFVVDNDYSRPGDEPPTALTPPPPSI